MSAPFRCRACGAAGTRPVLDLGPMPLANALLTAEQCAQPETAYPLAAVFCPQCTLVQITETVPPEVLFRDYFYFSSFSDTVLRNAEELAARLSAARQLTDASLVLEIASNDGYLLKSYRQRGLPVLGVEPARNIARVAEERGIPTLVEFFDDPLARRLRDEGRQADVLHANNVVAHVAHLHEVVAGIATVLKPDGLAVIENHYVRNLIEQVEFDSIYHEHLCYYSATSFRNLFRQHGLELVDVEPLPVHGGSLRAFFQRADGPQSWGAQGGAARAQAFLEGEQAWGVGDYRFYQDFGLRVEALRRELLALLGQLKAEGRRIAVYGASAKSTTLLNYFGLGAETFPYVADRSTAKQGRFTPGTHLPIVAPEQLLADQPDYVLLLSWNFADEILAQQAEYRRRGGRFILPIPQLQVV